MSISSLLEDLRPDQQPQWNINFLFLVLAPLLTMHLFSEERKTGTFDLLLMSKLKEMDIIWGKFLGSFTAAGFIVCLTLILPAILWFEGYSDWPGLITSYIGTFLNLACYLGIGLLCSSLVRSQILAAVLAFCCLFTFLLFSWSASLTSNELAAQLFAYISIPFHFEAFSKGAIRSFDLVYFFSFFSSVIYLTYLSIISKRW